jgi:hypothetical protein
MILLFLDAYHLWTKWGNIVHSWSLYKWLEETLRPLI